MVGIGPVSLSAVMDIYPEAVGFKLRIVNKQKVVENEFIRRIKNHQGILNKISFVYATDKWDRQDLNQEIIFQLWRSYPSFKGQSEFSTWMYRVALNTAITMVKKRKDRGVKFRQYSDHFQAETELDYTDDIQILHKAISRLNRIEKAIVLMYLEEKSYKEMAEALGMSAKNISVKLVRIKSKLAELIHEMQKENEF